MPNRFYATFGICRRKGGTKKVCYTKAMKAVDGRPKRRTKKQKRASRCPRGCKRS